MCRAFSCLILENGGVVWEFAVDSHEDLIASLKLPDDGRDQKFVRIEIAPKNGDYLKPDKWKFRVDQEYAPGWFRVEYAGKMCREAHTKWLGRLDSILIRKTILNPLLVKRRAVLTKGEIALLKKWADVWTSVRDIGNSVGDSVRDSVGGSVWDSLRDSVWASVWDSGNSVWDGVGDSVWASVRANVGGSTWAGMVDGGSSIQDSVGASVRAYTGSFLDLPRDSWKYTGSVPGRGYPYQPCVDLWERGLVPVFNGRMWRLHAGKDAKIVYEWTK